MDPSYPAYSPRQPTSNIPYASVNASTYPYPPNSRYDRSGASLDSSDSSDQDHGGAKEGPEFVGNPRVNVDVRAVNRTPSPTPSEAKELAKTGMIDWATVLKWRYWVRKEWGWYYVIFIVCFVGVILFTVYHKQIVNWLMPAATWMHDLPFGWLIPIGVLFVISFPPLFGHEIVAILCGLVWGLGPGFGIVAAGTFLGELGNFYAFKYCCSARGEKLEKNKLSYACLARVVREGGFKIALIARLSAIPGHFTTAVFSTCGMGVITFSIAAILSLPKQFITVYLGVALEQSEDGTSSTSDTIIKDVVLGVTTLITFGAMWYIYHQMNKVKPQVIYDRRKARQAKMMEATGSLPYGNSAVLDSTTSVVFNPAASSADIPLAKYGQPTGYAVHAPQPRRPQQPPPQSNGYPMSERTPYGGPALPPGAGYAYPGPPSQMPMHQVTPPSQYQDPFADSARVQSQAGNIAGVGVSYQRQAPPRGYGSPPPDTFTRRQPQQQQPQSQQSYPQSQPQPQRLTSPPPPAARPTASAPQTPTQRSYPQSQIQPQGPPPLPSMAGSSPPHNPFSDPMPNPYDRVHVPAQTPQAYPPEKGGHEIEPSDATFYTATPGHSRDVTEVSGFDSNESVREDAPPSYTFHAR